MQLPGQDCMLAYMLVEVATFVWASMNMTRDHEVTGEFFDLVLEY